MTSKWTRELSKLAIWDPAEEGLEPHVDYDQTKITHLMKRWILENRPAWEKEHGMTAYDIAKTHPTLNNMLVLTDRVTPEDYDKKTKEGTKGAKLFYPCIEDPETYLNAGRDCATELTKVLGTTDSVKLGGLGKLKLPSDASVVAINALLKDGGLPALEALFDELGGIGATLEEKDAAIKALTKEGKGLTKETVRLKEEVTNLMTRASAIPSDFTYTNDRIDVPEGKVVMKKASELFPIKLDKDFEVPAWEWEGDHPDVPPVDEEYIFRKKHLQRALYALITNQREYIQGHTGTGKTTLIEQIAARLSWPFIRINFDSEITRMDLIGRDTLVSDEDGKVTSKFEDGMLPTAMAGPYICCFDELDFVRPDVAYVMQAALEGGGLRITEDGDRIVRPHPMFRMFGTGNTVGQGDEHGMYQGARPQSMAFLDRFTVWDKIEYLTANDRKSLVERRFPALGEEEKKQILQYTTEHLEAFTQGKVIQPISPRGMLAICQATILIGSVRDALEMSVLDRANIEDRATLQGLVERVSK